MSERGSVATEYVYCDVCRKIVRDAIDQEFTIRFEGGFIAAFASGSWCCEEIFRGESAADVIAGKICHRVRFVVLADHERTAVFQCIPAADGKPGYYEKTLVGRDEV